MKILVLQGINLDMFGKRDPAHYGTVSLDEITAALDEQAAESGMWLEHFQSNCEGAFCERIHQASSDATDGVLINAGAWTHYNYGIRDALAMLAVPVIELHMSHVHAREPFRHTSVFSNVVAGQISGFGMHSYTLALRAMHTLLAESSR